MVSIGNGLLLAGLVIVATQNFYIAVGIFLIVWAQNIEIDDYKNRERNREQIDSE